MCQTEGKHKNPCVCVLGVEWSGHLCQHDVNSWDEPEIGRHIVMHFFEIQLNFNPTHFLKTYSSIERHLFLRSGQKEGKKKFGCLDLAARITLLFTPKKGRKKQIL